MSMRTLVSKGEREVALVGQLLGRGDGDFAGGREFVVLECGLAELLAHLFLCVIGIHAV